MAAKLENDNVHALKPSKELEEQSSVVADHMEADSFVEHENKDEEEEEEDRG